MLLRKGVSEVVCQRELKISENRLTNGFLENEKNRMKFESYISNPTQEKLDELNIAFKKHYFKIKCLSYFSKVLSFEAKHYDKKRSLVSNRFQTILDAPVSGEDNITLKDSIKDDVTTETEIRDGNWENEINHEHIRNSLKELTNRQKESIRYYFFEGMKDREIASLWGTSKQSVSKTKQTALRKIRGELQVG